MLLVGTRDVLAPDLVSVRMAGEIDGSLLVRFKGLQHVESRYAHTE